MNIFVDTSVWSLAFRRDFAANAPEVNFLKKAIEGGDSILTTGLVLQELLQGFRGPKAKEKLLKRFSFLPFLVPDRDDHIEAAELRNACRRKGFQIGTIDALFAQLCIHHHLQMLTTDNDFKNMARVCPLSLVKV